MALVSKVKEPKVDPLNIDDIIGKPRNRIAKVGVELEGAWLKVPDGVVLEHDGSVFNISNGGVAPTGHKVGEIPLGPMFPAQLSTAIKKYYPNKVDGTCGLHVHMSFDTMYKYELLMVPEYQETVLSYLVGWAKQEGLPDGHPIWDRILNESRFCQKKFWPDEQIKSKKDHDQNRHGHRYTVINYAWTSHGTIECRVLPMLETAELAIRAVRRVLDVTNACLVKLGNKKRERIKEVLMLPYSENYEEYIEEVL